MCVYIVQNGRGANDVNYRNDLEMYAINFFTCALSFYVYI